MTDIQVFCHHAMATEFQVRIADEEKGYAAQAAHAAFVVADQLESQLSRFQANSDISALAQLAPGEKLRVSEPVYACLEIAQRIERATRGAFSITAAALQTQPAKPAWTLEPFHVRCDAGRLEFDLGAIGKGFALDRMAESLREWGCPAFLLVSGGSSILAGQAPSGTSGWSCGLGDDHAPNRYRLVNCSLSGSGLAVKGPHIFDPRTGLPDVRRNRAWALCSSAAESDAVSTASMILAADEIRGILAVHPDWLVFLNDGQGWQHLGHRPVPPRA